MPRSQVDFIKNLFKDFDLGNIFVVRSRRPAKNGRTQRSSMATHDERDKTIPAHFTSDVPCHSSTLNSRSSLIVQPGSPTRDPGPEISIKFSTTGSSWNESSAKKASDMAQTFLPFVQAIAGPIPLVGTPMKAAIGGLLEIFKVMDRRGQNKVDLDDLTSRLNRISRYLCNAPPPVQDHLERSRREVLISMLQDTSATLAALRERSLAYPSVTQDIAGCFTKIDRYLAEYLFSSQLQSQDDIRAVLASLQRQQEDHQRQQEDHQRQQEFLMRIEGLIMRGQSSVGPTVALGCVTLVDATGHEHPISVNFCTSFQQLNDMLPVLFNCDSIEAQIQRLYMENGQYDLCIDYGNQVTQLTSHGWPRIEEGTKIVMRVIIEQKTWGPPSEVDYQCQFCGAVNHLGVGSITHSPERQASCSIYCRECKRRFQISRGHSSTKLRTRSSDIDSNPGTDAEMLLIRNFHVQQSLYQYLMEPHMIVPRLDQIKPRRTAQDDTVLSRSQPIITHDHYSSTTKIDLSTKLPMPYFYVPKLCHSHTLFPPIPALQDYSDSDDTENDSNGTEEEEVLGAGDGQEVKNGEHCEDWEDNEQRENCEDGE